MARSRRRSGRVSRRPEPTDETPLDLGGVVQQAGPFVSANGFLLGCESVAVGVTARLLAAPVPGLRLRVEPGQMELAEA